MDITIPRTKLDENSLLSKGDFKTLTIELNIPSDSEWNCNLNITENELKIFGLPAGGNCQVIDKIGSSETKIL